MGVPDVQPVRADTSTAHTDHHAKRVLVVDDQRAFADAVALAVDSQRDLTCVGAVGSAEEALDFLKSVCPDVVLLDIALPGLDGITAISQIRSLCPDVRILILTANPSVEALYLASANGAEGFLPKDTSFVDILHTIRRRDALPIHRSLVDQIVRSSNGAPQDWITDPPPKLTPRETEVLLMLAHGRTVKQIAHDRKMSVHTCRGHVRSILAKLDAHSQLAAVLKAAQLGLLSNRRMPPH